METKIKVIRTCKQTGKKEEVSFEYALGKLTGYWMKKETEKMLLSGQMLWTPFAEYQIAKQINK